MLRLTAAICTWNRSPLLRQALHHLALAEQPPRVELEVIVVNNDCTDDTDETISSFGDRLPVRRLFDPRPGQIERAQHGRARGQG